MSSTTTNGGEIASTKASRVAGKSGLDRSAAGSGPGASRAIQPANNDMVSVNNSKSTPEKRNSPACGNGESPRKVLRRRGVKTEEEEDEDSETVIPADDMSDGPVEEDNNGGNVVVDTVCEDVSVAVTGKKNAIRGKVWRARNGDYVRYLCVDDGADYRPGGTVYLIIFFSL